MTGRRRASIRALVAPIVVTVLAFGPLTATILPTAASATTLPQDDPDGPPIQVTLSAIRPLAPQSGQTETVTGELRNTSDETVDDLSVRLQMGQEIGSRNEFDAYATDPSGPLPNDIALYPSAESLLTSPADTSLDPQQSERFTVSLPIDAASDGLPSDAWEVRPLGIVVYDSTNLSASDPAGRLKTFFSWAPLTAPAEHPTGVAWVWPLVDRPHHTVSGGWADDTLAPEIKPGGRLNTLLAAAAAAEVQRPLGRSRIHNVRVTWAIDPMLVNDAALMAAGYRVASGNTTVAGTGVDAAKNWLDALRAAVTMPEAAVLPLPFADPDIMAAVRRGLDAIVGAASTSGQDLLQRLLPGLTLLANDGWPPSGYADQAGLNAMFSLRDNTIVLDGSALPPETEPDVTPTAHTTFTTTDGPVDVVLTDPTLSDDVQDGANNPSQQGLDLQRFLAETLMIQAENPTTSRDVVIAPDRRWNPDAAYANALLADTGRVPWIRSVGLQQVQEDPPDTTVTRRQLTYPPSIRRHELTRSYLAAVAQFRNAAAAVTGILPNGGAGGEATAFSQTEQEALSSGWRNDQTLALQRLAAATKVVQEDTSQVSITSHTGSYVTLTSHNGKVPVTVLNNRDTQVNVDVSVAPNQRLTLSHGVKVPATIDAHAQSTVFINVGAKTSGVFPLQVQLFTPDGNAYGAPVQLYVRSTAYGTVTLVITGAATAALLIAVGIRLGRRALAARRTAATATS